MVRIYITRTQGEWKAMETILAELQRKAIPSYVRNECHKIVKEYKGCEDCVTPAEGEPIKWQFCIPDDDYIELKKIAEKMKKTVSSMIDEMVISPLLLPK